MPAELYHKIATTSSLDIAFEEHGPPDGMPVILLHGWPDDVRTWDEIVPGLAEAGYRVLVPWLRGFGPTRFRDPDAMRSGQLSALGRDVLDFADVLGIERFAMVGHDWGARAAYIAACLAPDRVMACTALSVGWGTNDPDQPLSFGQAQNYWYHWLMALPRGERLVREDRKAFTRYIWSIWTGGWAISDEAFAITASAFDNPDWADVVLHSYRVRWGLAEPDPSCAALEARLRGDPAIRVPTLVLHGEADPCNAPATSEGREALFDNGYRRHVLPGIGHFPQREASDAVLRHLLPFLTSAIGMPAP
ncbi:alpha/beta hydrolase [Mesorhizobium sp. M1E.F.Ca.ET.045.02.1.1]|uniref:alpha/beta fold hydrolase n=3 Tax=unclassified Mesorhizobium TaxID=325217 RepID=UPI000F75B769|nr:alpha/beta hydrolase [Mesorhizobium sp. M1E.F.Ca.ET.045.02.1.1]AZO20515.1 alpha/beta hydrolase [Mesorhizobium sp. M1E.F.Ca.ET.045.02.1.1]